MKTILFSLAIIGLQFESYGQRSIDLLFEFQYPEDEVTIAPQIAFPTQFLISNLSSEPLLATDTLYFYQYLDGVPALGVSNPNDNHEIFFLTGIALQENESYSLDRQGAFVGNPGQYEYCFELYIRNGQNAVSDNVMSNNKTCIDLIVTEAPVTGLGIEKSALVEVFPNPVTTHLFLIGDDLLNSVTLTALDGSKAVVLEPLQKEWNVSMLENGYYLLTVESERGKFVQKIQILK